MSLRHYRESDFIEPDQARWFLPFARATGFVDSRLRLGSQCPPRYRSRELERLKAIRRDTALVVSNHPSRSDGWMIGDLLQRLGPPFAIASARKNFAAMGGLAGWFQQKSGAYSVRRGAVDREFIQTTRTLLSTPGMKVAIFPEGSTTGRYDQLTGYPEQVFAFATKAAADLSAQEPLWVVPVALVYHPRRSLESEILSAVAALEVAFDVSQSPTDSTIVDRLLAVGVALMEAFEKEHGLARGDANDLNERLLACKSVLAHQIAAKTGAELPADLDKQEVLRRVRSRIYMLEDQRSVNLQSREDMLQMERFENWMPVSIGYLRERPNTIRALDLIWRFQKEWNNRCEREGRQGNWLQPVRTSMDCSLRIGEPIDVREWVGKHGAEAPGELDKHVEQVTSAMLEERIW